jgi:serine/threonine protein kinase
MLQPGTIVDGKFEILGPLSRGAFGVIYKARHVGFDRNVALKLMVVPDPELQQEFLKRFEREGRILCGMQHKNLVAFHGYGTYEGSPYIAMGLIDGEDLDHILARTGKFSFHEAATVLKQVAAAITCVHNQGIVHRDLKPANIMLCPPKSAPLVKVIDFGLAKPAGDMQKLTQTGLTVGTSEYMSPEQCMGRQADWRSDIYSLGCILHHCLTGAPPFEGKSDVSIMRQHVDLAPPRLAALADVPLSAQYIVDKAMAKKPELRYQSMSDFQADLESLDSGEGVLIADGAPAAGPVRTLQMAKMQLQHMFLLLCILSSGALGVGLSFYFLERHRTSLEQLDTRSSFDYATELRMLHDRGKSGTQIAPNAVTLAKTVLQKNASDHLLDDLQLGAVYETLGQGLQVEHQYTEAADAGKKAMDIYLRLGVRDARLMNSSNLYIDNGCRAGRQKEVCDAMKQVVDNTGILQTQLVRAYIEANRLVEAEEELKYVDKDKPGRLEVPNVIKDLRLAKERQTERRTERH